MAQKAWGTVHDLSSAIRQDVTNLGFIGKHQDFKSNVGNYWKPVEECNSGVTWVNIRRQKMCRVGAFWIARIEFKPMYM